MNRLIQIFCIVATFCGVTQTTKAQPTDKTGVTYAIVSGYPDNPAMIDDNGSFTNQYVKKADKVDERKGHRHVSFPFELHKKQRICQARAADIHPYRTGSIIIELNLFFPASLLGSGKMGCDANSRSSDIYANSLEQYLAGEWAKLAISDGVVAKVGTPDDPLCIKNSAVSCPTPNKRADRFRQFELWRVTSCRPVQSDCIVLNTKISERRSPNHFGLEMIDFEVRFATDHKGQRKLVDFNVSPSPPAAPGLPGTPKVVRPVSVRN